MLNASEQALLAARERGAVDEPLLAVLRAETMSCCVEQVEGTMRPAVRQIGNGASVLCWTSRERAERAGWSAGLAERSGADIAELLRGTGLGLAINPGEEVGVSLGPDGVQQLAAATVVRAGTPMYLGAPERSYASLEGLLLAAFADLPQVLEARIVEVVIGGDRVPAHPMLVLTLDKTAGSKGFAAAATACGLAVASAPLTVDVVEIEQLGGLRPTATQIPPFYVRPVEGGPPTVD